MSCNNKLPELDFKCNENLKPMPEDFLNGHIISRAVDKKGNTTIEYYLPNEIQIKSINESVHLSYNGQLEERPGFYSLTAYILADK